MDGANKQFISKKAAWLKDNMIFYNVNHTSAANPFNQALVAPGTGGILPIAEFDLRKIPSVKDAANKTYKAYYLHQLDDLTGAKKNVARDVGKHTHAINAYFLAWGSHKTYEGLLGNGADFFFTPTVNGCSFAATNGAAPRVVHSNHANRATQKIDQGLIDADLGAIFGVGGPDVALRKADYKGAAVGTADYMASIVGIRSHTGWTFYYQRYLQDTVHKPGIGSVFENVVLNSRVRIT
jgi:hypothetical protein